MRCAIFLILLALSSASCAPSVANPGPAPDAPPMRFADKDSKGGGVRTFAYSWAAAVSREPRLVGLLTAERDSELASQKREWQAALREAPEGCTPCLMRDWSKAWTVLGDVPGYLSLAGDVYVYSGGAHGISNRTSLIWDRRAGKALEAIDLFNSPAALQDALGGALCDALDAERARRRGEPVDRSTEQWPEQCPGLAEATVLVGSTSGRMLDRIAVYFGPYVAGPYAEGSYELGFPVTPAIRNAVRREYAALFAEAR